jgi:5-methylcytosine-specific restriction endonuclease McrA
VDKYKTCSKCREPQQSNNYYSDKRASDGLQSQCKQCIANYRKENKDKVQEQKQRYRSKPETRIKELEYAKRYSKAHPEVVQKSRDNEDKNKKRERFQRWALANKPRIKANRIRAVENNPGLYRSYSSQRRGRIKAAQSFVITKKELLTIYKQKCFYCNGPGGTIDHVIPLSRGGSHGIGNLVAACLSCNSRKKDKTIMEWKRLELLRPNVSGAGGNRTRVTDPALRP